MSTYLICGHGPDGAKHFYVCVTFEDMDPTGQNMDIAGDPPKGPPHGVWLCPCGFGLSKVYSRSFKYGKTVIA